MVFGKKGRNLRKGGEKKRADFGAGEKKFGAEKREGRGFRERGRKKVWQI